jgi:hypothetical protein
MALMQVLSWLSDQALLVFVLSVVFGAFFHELFLMKYIAEISYRSLLDLTATILWGWWVVSILLLTLQGVLGTKNPFSYALGLVNSTVTCLLVGALIIQSIFFLLTQPVRARNSRLTSK